MFNAHIRGRHWNVNFNVRMGREFPHVCQIQHARAGAKCAQAHSNDQGNNFRVAKTMNPWFVVALLKQPMTDKLYFGATTACRLNDQPNTFMRTQFLKKLCAFACIGLALILGGNHVSAQLSVGPLGLAPQTFDSSPSAAQWATRSVLPSSAGNITTGAQLDAAVQTNAASTVTAALATDLTTPVPGTDGSARWNSPGRYLQARPTGNSFTLLKATLQNNTGSNQSSIQVSYNLGALVAAGSTITEQIPGYRVYYSFTGAAGTWVQIPALNSATPASQGPVSATLALGSWPNGSTLYLLWADDNGSASTTAPNHEGAYTIDNFAVTLPYPVIINHPQNSSVAPGQSVTLNVTAAGAQPLFYQWRKNSNNIPNATNASFAINNAQPTDAGFYSVLVSNAFGTVISSNALVSVNCAAPATFVSGPADQSLSPGGAISLTTVVSGTAPVSYQWYRSGVPLPNATNSTFTKVNAQPSDSGLYSVTINNCAELPSSASAVVSVSQLPYVLFGLTNHFWKYEQSNTDLNGWEAPGYNDAAWPQGRGVFAFEDAGAIVPLINTTLNHFDPDYITRYFRTTFVLTNDPSSVFLVTSNLIDDGMVVYLNGTEAFRYNMPGGTIGHNTTANAANPAGEGTFIVSNIPPGLWVQGTNTMAVEMHQNGTGSSDSVFGMELRVGFIPPTLLVITNQPQSATVVESQPATFTLGIQGGPAYYQWFKDGSPIPNATANPFTIPIVTMMDTGSYYGVATNSVNTVTSSVVTLSVLTDTNGPTLLEADGTISNTLVLVRFSERVLASTATNTANYRITNTTAGGTLTISSAVLVGGTNVQLATATPRVINNNYLLIVNNVRDISPLTNAIAPNSAIPISFRAPIIDMNSAWRYYDPFPPFDEANLGTAWKEFTYTETGWGDGHSVFYNGPAEEDVPDPIAPDGFLSQTPGLITYFRKGFNLQASPAGLQFFLTHIIDDGAVFYLNGTETLRNNMPSGTINYNTPALSTVANITRVGPALISLPSYRMGSNVLAVELHQTQNVDVDKAFGMRLEAKVQSFVSGPVIVTSHPADQTVTEGQTATFQVMQVGGSTFQWQSNNVSIAGATNGTYSVVATTNMHGSQYRVAVSNATSGTLSGSATLRVLVDSNAPTLVSASYAGANSILVSFSEVLHATSANTAGNYLVTNSLGAVASVSTAVLQNGTNVLLTFSSPLSGRHTVVVNNVTDNSSRRNPIAPNSTVTVGVDFLVSLTSPWKYLITNANTEIHESYASPSFNDSAWRGPSNSLFYVEGSALPAPKSTPLSLQASGNYVYTFYFRTALVSPIEITNLMMNLRHVIDDGLVLYLNGQEIFRFNMAPGSTTPTTEALAPAIGNATLVGPVSIPVNLLAGTNVLAAEVHQNGTDSSDVVFGIELAGSIPSVVVPPPAAVQIVEQPRSRTNSVGATAFFRVSATGAQPITFQWYRNGVLLPGETSALLTITNAETDDLTNYFATAANSFSSATSQVATLVLTGGPVNCAIIPTWTNSLRIETNSLSVTRSNNATTIVLSWTNPVTNAAPCSSSAQVVLQRALTMGSTYPVPSTVWTNIYTNVVGTARVTNTVPAGVEAYYRLKVN